MTIELREIEQLRLAAEQGDDEAQAKLGTMYLHGHEVMRDDVQALAWFKKAATQGNAIAMFIIGMIGECLRVPHRR
jgi:TPR repeat protein